MQIKDLAIGDGFVYLMEGSTKVKFYALCHNYESGLNGTGRTLFCRESPATSGIRCQTGSSYSLGWGTINYGGTRVTNAKRKPKNPEQYPRQMKTRWVKISKKQ